MSVSAGFVVWAGEVMNTKKRADPFVDRPGFAFRLTGDCAGYIERRLNAKQA